MLKDAREANGIKGRREFKERTTRRGSERLNHKLKKITTVRNSNSNSIYLTSKVMNILGQHAAFPYVLPYSTPQELEFSRVP